MALGTTNITTSLVRNEILESINAVGGLCVSDNVNMWSKAKPSKTEAGWNSGDFSLTYPSYNNTDTQVWTYEKPTGGALSAYRLGDFRNYAHNSQIPLALPSAPAGLNFTFTIIALGSSGGGYNVNIPDMSTTGDLRLGVQIYNSIGGIMDWASESSLGAGIPIDLNGYLNNSQIDVKFFLVDVYKEWGATGVSNARYSLPREFSTQNKDWLAIPVSAPATEPAFFSVVYDIFDNEFKQRVESISYTGPINIKSKKTDGTGLTYQYDYTLTTAGVQQLFTESELLLQDGAQYTSELRYGTASDPVIDTITWTMFGTAP